MMLQKYRMFIVTALAFISTTAVGLTLNAAQSAGATGTCVQTTSFTMPQPVALGSAATGVTIDDAGKDLYRVGGDSVNGVRDALNACAPRGGSSASGEFLAYTNYTVNYSYGLQDLGNGTCRLSDVKVGLALSQTFPALTTDSASVRAKWTAFINGLTTHENGHKSIDIAQAHALYDSLSGLQAPCASIASDAVRLTTDGVANFVSANADHDTVTDHGVTQGAVW